MSQIQQALKGIGYGIIGALIVQIAVNTISPKQEQALTKPVLLKDLSQKQIDSMNHLSNTITLAPVKSHQEQNSSFKSFIAIPEPIQEGDAK